MTLDSRLVVSPEALDRKVGDRIAILDHSTGRYFALDGAGSRMWELLAETTSLRAVLERMLEEYDVPRDRLAEDLLRIAGYLQASGLVELVTCP